MNCNACRAASEDEQVPRRQCSARNARTEYSSNTILPAAGLRMSGGRAGGCSAAHLAVHRLKCQKTREGVPWWRTAPRPRAREMCGTTWSPTGTRGMGGWGCPVYVSAHSLWQQLCGSADLAQTLHCGVAGSTAVEIMEETKHSDSSTPSAKELFAWIQQWPGITKQLEGFITKLKRKYVAHARARARERTMRDMQPDMPLLAIVQTDSRLVCGGKTHCGADAEHGARAAACCDPHVPCPLVALGHRWVRAEPPR